MSSGENTDPRLLLLNDDDNILVAVGKISSGEALIADGRSIIIQDTILLGHKIARQNISAGEKIIKYGFPIGSATTAIIRGQHVHVHNIQSDYTQSHSLSETSDGLETQS